MTTHAPTAVAHAFTVDVEEYFQVNAFESLVSREQWPEFSTRLEVGLLQLLDLLAERRATGTFFTLGWVAERHPALIRRIVEGGHEVASHGFWHRRVMTQSRAQFAEDIRASRRALEDVIGMPVLGYRAPSFSIIRETEWALEELAAAGFIYDSSRFPIRRPGYGSPHVALDAHVVTTRAGPLLEIPMTVLEVGGYRLPAAGGGWFRQFPRWVTEQAVAQQARRKRSAVFYIHPWELDPEQPRLPVGRLTRVRHYRGLDVTATRIAHLLKRFPFGSIREVYSAQLAALPGREQ